MYSYSLNLGSRFGERESGRCKEKKTEPDAFSCASRGVRRGDSRSKRSAAEKREPGQIKDPKKGFGKEKKQKRVEFLMIR